MIKTLALDFDGTIVNTYQSPFLNFKKILPILPPRFYFLYELMEIAAGTKLKLHTGAEELIKGALGKGIMVGIVTDRTELGLAEAARACGLNLKIFDFIHARKTPFPFSLLRKKIPAPRLILTNKFKGTKGALAGLDDFLRNKKISAEEVLLVGDSERDQKAAQMHGYLSKLVNGRAPDFKEIRELLEISTDGA